MLTLMYLLSKAKAYVLAFPYKREVLIGLALILFGAGLFRYCTSPGAKPQVDLEQVQRINSENEKERREALEQVIAKVDAERAVRDDEIDAIEKRIETARRSNGRDVTAEELERIISQYR